MECVKLHRYYHYINLILYFPLLSSMKTFFHSLWQLKIYVIRCSGWWLCGMLVCRVNIQYKSVFGLHLHSVETFFNTIATKIAIVTFFPFFVGLIKYDNMVRTANDMVCILLLNHPSIIRIVFWRNYWCIVWKITIIYLKSVQICVFISHSNAVTKETIQMVTSIQQLISSLWNK